jgi:glycosyltransferase involved in cell wall biosynthesis
MKNIIFVYDKFDTGGIETLILRMTTWLIKNEYNVTILMKKKGNIFNSFDSNINFIILGRWYSYMYFPFIAKMILGKYNLMNMDVIMSFHPKSNWVASNIMSSLNLKCRYITGVYHPRAYYNEGLHISEKVIYQKVLRSFDSNTVLFMNEDCKKLHNKKLYLSFTESYIWPLPVNIPKKTIKRKNIKKYLIVSIGRLAAFKTYNVYMLDIIKKLIDEGYNIQYDIYGTGELEVEMRKKIIALNLENSVALKGLLDYDLFSTVLENAYLFVGMGTSVLEASLAQVPTIVAIENNDNGETYGYLNQLPYYNVGEENLNLEVKSVYTMIKDTLDLEEHMYQKLSLDSAAYVQPYSIDVLMPKWIDYVNNRYNTPIKISGKLRAIYIILELLNPLLKYLKRK